MNRAVPTAPSPLALLHSQEADGVGLTEMTMGGTDDRRTERSLLVITLALVSLGIVMVYSSSCVLGMVRWDSGSFFLKRHLVRVGVGLVAMLLAARIRYTFWVKISRVLLILGFVLLGWVLFQKSIRGATRWVPFFGTTLQPSEVMKLLLVFYLSDYLVRHRDCVRSFRRGFLPPALILSFAIGMIILQPNLGMAASLSLIVAIMLFVGGARVSHLAVAGVVALALVCILVYGAGYRRDRVDAFLSGEKDVRGSAYHSHQSVLSLGSGRAFGVGLGQSRQKMFFLPDPHTDFIFSIIGEELGFFGTLTTLCLFLAFGRCGLQIAGRAQDLQGAFLSYGIVAMVLVPACLNIGVVTGMLPVTGLPLPFLSYGGSSLVVTLAATGILINIGRYRKTSELSYGRFEGSYRPSGVVRTFDDVGATV